MTIAITGLGAVTCCGNSINELWHNIINGNSGILPISAFQPKVIKSKKIGEVRNFELNSCFDNRWKQKTDRHIHFALNAAKEAIDQSGLSFSNIEHRTHTIIGTTAGCYDFIIKNQIRIDSGRPSLPTFIPGHINNMMSAYINMHYGIHGAGLGIAGACAAGSQALSIGAMMIETGQADVVIAGASDSWLSEVVISGFESLGAISFDDILPRPFDVNRSGFAISEGAGVIILENYEHAKKRNANILAKLVSYGISSDAYHPTSPDPAGKAFNKMTLDALKKAKLNYDQIDYINAHATATKIGDIVESKNLQAIFGNSPYVSSTKSMTGHSIGSTSVIEAIICVMALNQAIIPPTINLETIDPECNLNHVTESIERNIRYALSTSFGFGGTNGILIFER